MKVDVRRRNSETSLDIDKNLVLVKPERFLLWVPDFTFVFNVFLRTQPDSEKQQSLFFGRTLSYGIKISLRN